MDRKYRLWSREPEAPATDLSLTQRLNQLAQGNRDTQNASGAAEPEKPAQTASAPVGSNASASVPAAGANAQASSAPAEAAAPEKPAAGRAETTVREASVPANGSALRAIVETSVAVAEAEDEPEDFAGNIGAEPQSGERQGPANSADKTPEAAPRAAEIHKSLFRLPRWGTMLDEPESVARVADAQSAETPKEANEAPQQAAVSAAPSPAAVEPVVEQAEPVAEPAAEVKPTEPVKPAEPAPVSASPSPEQALGELQIVWDQFEAEMRTRLDDALAEMEQRMPAPVPVEEVTARLEQKAKVAADNISREVQGQARVMLDAVANELRGFRDQFGRDVQDRVRMLDRATMQALQMKEKLEDVLPKAEELLRAMASSQQEGTARLREATALVEEQLRLSREELASFTKVEGETLKALAVDCRQDEQRLKEEVDRFHREAEAAGDIFVRVADQSLERLNTGAEEAETRVRLGLEKVATEVESRILSGGLVEKATDQIEEAAQQVIEPMIDRVRNAGAEANSSADSLNRVSNDVLGRLDAARRQVESRLDELMTEQQAVLEAGMAGFQRKATEELGSLVERVVAESSEQLNDRLHALFQDLLISTSQQINTATRSTLNTLHDGLKEVFEPQPEGQEAESGAFAGQD